MNCPRCEHVNRPDAKFCEECAAPLARKCSHCGAQLSATGKFCSECAHPADPAAPSASLRLKTPEPYTPKHLAEKILTSKAASRAQVTVLSATSWTPPGWRSAWTRSHDEVMDRACASWRRPSIATKELSISSWGRLDGPSGRPWP
jgi:hypothetical protein